MDEVPELPDELRRLLDELDAPPRLSAHLRLVHAVAAELLVQMALAWPGLKIDAALVRFGAASHDIGKALVPQELSVPGKSHERLGQQLLLEKGFSRAQARFCVSHGQWEDAMLLEDLLVALADKIWKGKREVGLENRVVDYLAQDLGQPRWQIFTRLDTILSEIAAGADQRLAWQNAHHI